VLTLSTTLTMKNIALILGLILLIGIVAFMLLRTSAENVTVPTDDTLIDDVVVDTDEIEIPTELEEGEVAPALPVTELGMSAGGRPIMVHTFGTGRNDILIVGGMHGAYAPNTTEVAERLIALAESDPQFVPAGVTLHVVPTLNPDGAALGTTPAGRFNANGVDLNRNFDCEWQAEGIWQSQAVSGGSEPFSEPEAAALRSYVAAIEPVAAVVYYSAAGGVYSSNCRNGVSAETKTLTDVYAQASDYAPFAEFDFYAITGDAVNWMAKEGVAAISVLMTDYTSPEWEKNRAGLAAVLELYAE